MNYEKRFEQLREASGNVVYTDALTGFLYVLMRDYLVSGTVEKLVADAVSTQGATFTNGWLAKYANNLAEQINNAKTNNFAKVLTEAFGDEIKRKAEESRPSFKSEEKTLEERVEEGKKVVDALVSAGQLKPEEAEAIKQEAEEFKKEQTNTKLDGEVKCTNH